MLNSIIQNDYLNCVLIPSFLPMVEQSLYFAVYDDADQVLVCSNSAAKELGFDTWLDIQGKVYKDLSPKGSAGQNASEYGGNLFNSDCWSMREVNRELFHLKRFIFDDARPVSVAVIQAEKQQYINQFYTATYIPLFNPEGKVVAIQEVRTSFSMFGLPQFLHEVQSVEACSQIDTASVQITPTAKLPIQLTERQHEIIFLLTNGFSQESVATLLHISRGTIAKTISNSICPKFDIWGSSTIILVQKAKALNLHLMMPPSFCKPRFAILDLPLATRYQEFKEQQKLEQEVEVVKPEPVLKAAKSPKGKQTRQEQPVLSFESLGFNWGV